jgi:hypothetical protein
MMEPVRLVSRINLALLGMALLVCAIPVPATQDPWFKYENSHFVAYSDAAESKVMALMDNLERFRGAVLQVSNIKIPQSAPKTLVVITRDRSTFSRLTPHRNTAGFAISDGTQTLIVLPAFGSTSWTHSVIRHEYGHALLRFMEFSYPTWYEEGFAEMVSATEFKNSGQEFTLGHTPERAMRPGNLSYNWDTLVSDDFEPHTIESRQQASSAYFQAWLLAHYTTLGDSGKNAQKLQLYFTFLKNGDKSETAFQNAFGKSASELWKSELKSYTKRVPNYVIRFNPGMLDTNFTRTSAPTTEIEPIINSLEASSMESNQDNVVPIMTITR